MVLYYAFWLMLLPIQLGISYLTDPQTQMYVNRLMDNGGGYIHMERFRPYIVQQAMIGTITIFAYFTIGFFLIEALRWVFSRFKRG